MSRKMMSLLQWIVAIAILVSVTYLPGASSELSDGVTQHINVSLSNSDCTHPSCFTWSEYLMDPSQCFSSYSNVTLLPGEYPLHQYLLVRDVESLSIYGGVPVSGHARDNQVVINCNGTAGGIGFINVTDFVLSGVTLMSCGASGADVIKGFRNIEVLYGGYLSFRLHINSQFFALYIMQGFNVTLNQLFITNSTQSGLLYLTPHGNTCIQDSVFTYSNYKLLERYMHGKVDCSEDNWECFAKNIWILYIPIFPTFKMNTVSNITVERTEISYGVNLRQSQQMATESAGLGLLTPPPGLSEHPLHVTISKSSFQNNFGFFAAHLFMGIFANSSVFIDNCSFTHANIIREENNRIKWNVVHPRDACVKIRVATFELMHIITHAIAVQVTLSNVHITENFGGGLHISSSTGSRVPANVTVKLKKVKVVQNYLFYAPLTGTAAVLLSERRANSQDSTYMLSSLQSVEISNNSIVFSDESELTKDLLWKEGIDFGCMKVQWTEVHFNQTVFYNNSITAVYSIAGDLHFYGVNNFRNNTGVCGGALSLNHNSLMYLHPGTQLYIVGNSAVKYGGGICVNRGFPPTFLSDCFYKVMDPNILYQSNTFIYLEGNKAAITGYTVFGGPVNKCFSLLTYTDDYLDVHITSKAVFEHVFHMELNSPWYQISSLPHTVCFCAAETPHCERKIKDISVYPGQTFKVWAVGIGFGSPSDGISPAIVRSRIESKYYIFPELQSLSNACEPLNYTVLAPEGISGILVLITVERYAAPDKPKRLNITTLKCPNGFILQQSECGCHPMLQRASIRCEIDTKTFTRSGTIWIGVSEREGLLTHMHCPNAYCKLQQVEFKLDTPDAQCASDHSGILCGECKDGFALVLGSSRCQHCSYAYLVLIVVFAIAGLLLVMVLGRLNITVASGTMNGVLFFTNVVKPSSDAFISSFVSKHFTIIIAWLNLDLGIEVCFSSHLDMFWKSLLQFAFPLYIWLLVAGIIVLSRYSTLAARLSGRNAVPVLATLFLLSYAKVLDTIIAAFSFTSVEAEKNGPLVVWLHDGNLKYMQGKHIALVVVSSLFAIFYIIPLTLLLLFAPALQRIGHYRVVRLIQRLKPILDAFQGPYKDKFRWWPGLMLVVRIILFIALTANTTHDPRLSVLLVALAVFALIPVGLIWFGGVYKNKLLITLETALNSSLLIFAMWSLFNYSAYGNKAELSKHQQAAAYTMISIFYALLMGVLFYHIAKKLTDLGIPDYLMNFIRRRHGQQGDGEGEEIEMRGRQDSGCAPVAQPPTVSVVDLRELREPLLTD